MSSQKKKRDIQNLLVSEVMAWAYNKYEWCLELTSQSCPKGTAHANVSISHREQRNTLLFHNVLPHLVDLLGWRGTGKRRSHNTTVLWVWAGQAQLVHLCHIPMGGPSSSSTVLLQTKCNTDQVSKAGSSGSGGIAFYLTICCTIPKLVMGKWSVWQRVGWLFMKEFCCPSVLLEVASQ
jgi:hypothetical protein